MTIAACYVSPEGVVLGADSTTTVSLPGTAHYFNHAQKLFEIGEDGTLGALTWGLGGLVIRSHRMLLARLADDLDAQPPVSVQDAATRWCSMFWNEYSSRPGQLAQVFTEFDAVNAKAAHNPTLPPSSNIRTVQEEQIWMELFQGLTVGFCIGGYVRKDREPCAFEIVVRPDGQAPPTPRPIPMHQPHFWGAPNMIWRLMEGSDRSFREEILNSPHWTGTAADLNAIAEKSALGHGILPIRDAVDFVYSSISSTIKALKFSNLPQICGGPIEIAVITADRPFRWVRHKQWDAAIMDGGT